MIQPPDSVRHVAKTHWLVGSVIALSIVFLNALTQKFPVEASARTYVVTFSLAGLYLLGGTLVWFGAPFGRFLSRVCALIYLARPAFGSPLWKLMDGEEYQAHFRKQRRDDTTKEN
jgi:hypothetical protein